MFQSFKVKSISLLAILALIIVGAVVFYNNKPSLISSNPAQPNNRTKIKIGYVGVVQSLATFVAQEKGYFKDAGLEAELIKFESPALIQDAIISGNIDVAGTAGTGIAAIVFSKDPNQFKIFNTSFADKTNPSDVLVVGKDDAANSLAELKGKTVALVPGPQFKTVFGFMAKQAGLKASEAGGNGDIFYRELAIPEQVPALKSGQIQAILGLDPVGTNAEILGVGKKIGLSPISTSLGFPFYGSSGLINQKFARENPESAKKVIQAFDKAITDVQANPNTQRQYLEKYLGLKEPALSKVALQAYKKSDELKQTDIQDIQKLIDIFVAEGVIKNKVDVRDMMFKI